MTVCRVYLLFRRSMTTSRTAASSHHTARKRLTDLSRDRVQRRNRHTNATLYHEQRGDRGHPSSRVGEHLSDSGAPSEYLEGTR